MAEDYSGTHPLECQDQYEEAEEYYNDELRVEHRALKNEVLSLKRLLRENSISWNSTVDFGRPSKRAKTRESPESGENKTPSLPAEIKLRIMEYALTAKGPIIDPLCRLNTRKMTEKELKERENGPQVAISLLATCSAYHTEGTKMFWMNNEFVFTTPAALRRFSEVPFEFRKRIERITLRIVAHYYDDVKRSHVVPHFPRVNGPTSSSRSSLRLQVIPRPRLTNSLESGGFRSYTWTQVSNFLRALRPPFDPDHDDSIPRPRLLPGLAAMRMDFVSFPSGLLDNTDTEFHTLTNHALGGTLDELMVTGMPECDIGRKALDDLAGMVKDNGLLLECKDAIVTSGKHLRALPDSSVTAKVVRAWKEVARHWEQIIDVDDLIDEDWFFAAHQTIYHHNLHHSLGDLPTMPTAPEEDGHPESEWKERQTIWKRVPRTRDSDEREWFEFGRILGELVGPYTASLDVNNINEIICQTCGIIHDPAGWEM